MRLGADRSRKANRAPWLLVLLVSSLGHVTAAAEGPSGREKVPRLDESFRGHRLHVPSPEEGWTTVVSAPALDHVEYRLLPESTQTDCRKTDPRIKGVTWRWPLTCDSSSWLMIQRIVVPSGAGDGALSACYEDDSMRPSGPSRQEMIGGREFTLQELKTKDATSFSGLRAVWRQPYGVAWDEGLCVVLASHDSGTVRAVETARDIVSRASLEAPWKRPESQQERWLMAHDLGQMFVPVAGVPSQAARQFKTRNANGVPITGHVMDLDGNTVPDAITFNEGTALATWRGQMPGTPVGDIHAVSVLSCFLELSGDTRVDLGILDGGDQDQNGALDARIALKDKNSDGVVDDAVYFEDSLASPLRPVQSALGWLWLRRWTPDDHVGTDRVRRAAVLQRANAIFKDVATTWAEEQMRGRPLTGQR